MHRVAGEEDTPFAEVVGQQQVLLPLADVEHLVLQRDADGLLELLPHILVALQGRVQGPVLGRVLHDEEGGLVVRHVVVATMPRPAVDRNAVEQLVAAIQRLPEFQQIAVAAQLDAELLAHQAAAAVTADEILGIDGLGFVFAFDDC